MTSVREFMIARSTDPVKTGRKLHDRKTEREISGQNQMQRKKKKHRKEKRKQDLMCESCNTERLLVKTSRQEVEEKNLKHEKEQKRTKGDKKRQKG